MMETLTWLVLTPNDQFLRLCDTHLPEATNAGAVCHGVSDHPCDLCRTDQRVKAELERRFA
jgi:hypothetical protein